MTTVAISQIEKFIPLTDAAQRLGMSVTKLRGLVQRGEVKAALMPSGELMINEQSIVSLVPKEALPEYKKYTHLQGKRISISDASRKYDVPIPTISRWVKKGHIKQLGKEGARVMVDEADAAYCAAVYHSQGATQGTRVFDKLGHPYQLKRTDWAAYQRERRQKQKLSST